MKVICGKLPFKKQECVATIGVFDGVHKGHQCILKKVKKESEKNNCFSLVITFTVPPRELLKGRLSVNNSKTNEFFSGQIFDSKQKIHFVRELGIDFFWLLKASNDFLELPAHSFIEYILNYFIIKQLIVGSDFRFGYKGKGDVGYLKKISTQYNFKVSVVKKKKIKDKIVSSSAIRNFIKKGNLGKAREFLGRDFCLKGKVFKGEGLGRKLGFPTANIDTLNYVVPVSGVYAAFSIIDKKLYLSAVNVGRKPTLNIDKRITVEVHIINFSKNILGKTLDVIFFKKIRDEHKFSSFNQLQLAIKKDIFQITAKYSVPTFKYPQPIGL